MIMTEHRALQYSHFYSKLLCIQVIKTLINIWLLLIRLNYSYVRCCECNYQEWFQFQYIWRRRKKSFHWHVWNKMPWRAFQPCRNPTVCKRHLPEKKIKNFASEIPTPGDQSTENVQFRNHVEVNNVLKYKKCVVLTLSLIRFSQYQKLFINEFGRKLYPRPCILNSNTLSVNFNSTSKN